MTTTNYSWTDNPTESGVQDCNTDILNECLMHLKYDNNNSGFQLFDTVLKDHILNYEKSQGLALQGTYVYKEAVAGSRYGYPDFYAKCLEEKELGIATETTLGDSTITLYNHTNGHKFYDIADKEVVDAFYNATGMAWFYGIDTENARIFLPRNDYFAVKDVSVETSIKGDGTSPIMVQISGSSNGIVRFTNNDGLGSGGTNSTTGKIGFSSDPTKSGLIADTLSKLTPDDTKYLYICVGNTTNYEGITEVVNQGMDILEQVNQVIESKANIDADNFTTNGKGLISGLTMPSNRYVDLTFGGSGSTYTAPANGWFCLLIQRNNSGNYLHIGNQTKGYGFCLHMNHNLNVGMPFPVSKGDVITIGTDMSYTFSDGSQFRFYYAEGEV